MNSLFTAPKISLPSGRPWFWQLAQTTTPSELEEIIPWADKHYRVLNNDADTFKSIESPWLIEPLEKSEDPLVTNVTFVKPIQTGGTSLGEIIIERRLLDSQGILSYYWPTNDKAKDRWEKFTERRLKACRPLRAIFPHEYENMFVKFPGIIFAMQGVFTPGNLDSDTIDIIVCEEVHQWSAGMVSKAKGRQTRVDFPKFIIISNAGYKGDQLHQEFESGTQQHFLNKCPGCGKLHAMRTRWEDNKPHLGGLRYDTENCKQANGTFNYNKLIPTIRYQFPVGSPLQFPDHSFCHCGYEMRDDIGLRRQSAQKGFYSGPQNPGALLSNRSYTYQSIACHNIRWLDLIQQKHTAVRSLKQGYSIGSDGERKEADYDFRIYVQERECLFYDPDEHRPYQGAVVLTSVSEENRKGLPNEAAKIWAADWQQGFKHLGELTHYWLVIESVDANCNAQVIFAGVCDDEVQLLQTLRDNGITDADGGGIFDGLIDASKNTKHILSFCYRHGINAVMGNASGKGLWKWPDGVYRGYSPKKFIYKELDMPPKYDLIATREGWVENPAEPFIVMYSKAALLKNHFFIREMKANVLANNPDAAPADYISRIVPSDIGEDYQKHHSAWERDFAAKAAKKMGEVEGFKQVARVDHLMSCTTYIDLYKDLSGLLPQALEKMDIERKSETET